MFLSLTTPQQVVRNWHSIFPVDIWDNNIHRDLVGDYGEIQHYFNHKPTAVQTWVGACWEKVNHIVRDVEK
jgi:hypothetical protein